MSIMKYYFCRQDLFNSYETIEIDGHNETTGQYLWTDGHKIPADLGVQTLILDPAYGEKFPAFFDTSVPVMSDELIAAFKECGVDNFDVYPVLLKRKDTGETVENYKMVNFLGCVDAFDKEESNFDPDDFEHEGPVVIDETKVQDLKAFRLSEPTDLLVVNEEIAEFLGNKKFYALLLQDTEDYDGD